MTTFKANRKFPNPITVTDDPKSHTLALQQIIEALSIGQRRTKEINSSYVRVGELVDAGLIEVVGNQLKLTNTSSTTITSGGGPVTPDTPPGSPNAIDDEFSAGSLDAKWIWENQGSANASLQGGVLTLIAPTAASDNLRILKQSISGTWEVSAKIAVYGSSNYNSGGLCVGNNSSGKWSVLGRIFNTAQGYSCWWVGRYNSATSYSASLLTSQAAVHILGGLHQFCYLSIEYDGTSIKYKVSGNGVNFATIYTETASAFLGTPDRIGLHAHSESSTTPAYLNCDWFRRIS